MADLVTSDELLEYLGGDSASDEDVLQRLLDQTEAALERAIGRTDRPFRAASAAVTEVYDGTGSSTLFLNYPIADLTSLTIGADTSEPDETLDVDDVAVLRWEVGRRRVVRVNGLFGARGLPRVVHVTYDAGADLPEDAALAVLVETARRYGRQGSEAVVSERLGAWSVEYGSAADGGAALPEWAAAIANHLAVIG